MSSYTEKIVIENWHLYITNGANTPHHHLGLWVELHNGLEYPVISSPSGGSIITSADPNYPRQEDVGVGNGVKVPLSDDFLCVLGEVLHYMDEDPFFGAMPASWVMVAPDDLPKTEGWVINQIVSSRMQGMLPYELEVLAEKAIEENSQCELHEFEEQEEAA